MPEMFDTVLITGASSGIGEAFARRLAARCNTLILAARREDRLSRLAEGLTEEHGVATHVLATDLSRPNSAAELFAELERLGLAVDLLVNNAGFAKNGLFAEIPLEVQADMVRLNVNTLMELTHLVLPGMRQRKRGGVINVASNAAFQPVPHLSVYAATKAFVLSFSEALAEEVAADGVRVMALCPGATATDFWAVAGICLNRMNLLPTPDAVAVQALRAFDRGRRVFVHGGANKLITWLVRLGPRRIVTHVAGRFMKPSR